MRFALISALLAYFVAADNYEFGAHEFVRIQCLNTLILREDLGANNSVKISYLGHQRMACEEVEPGHYVITDGTRYFGAPAPLLFRIDYEYKVVGLAVFAWVFSAYCTVVGLVCFWAACLFFRYTGEEGKRESLIGWLID